jgi:hypothetical protein
MANITGPPESVGGLGRKATYEHQIKPEITKESTQDYSWYVSEIPESQIEGGYRETKEDQTSYVETLEDKLAMVPSEAKIIKLTGDKDKKSSNQGPLDLVLLIIAIILGAAVVGLSLVKFRKKFP